MNINFKSTALAVAAVASLSMGAAHAAFTAYNDCAMSSTGNVTSYQSQSNVASPVYGASGLLKDYATGLNTGVTCTAAASGTLVLWTDPVVNVPYAAGTDAANYFNGKLNFVGSPEINGDAEWYSYTFSGLSANKSYKFVTSMNRNSSSYTTRKTVFSISGATAWTNISSAGTVVSGDGSSTTLCTGWNTPTGHVAAWNVVAGNGTFTVKAQRTPGTKTYGFGEIMLQEVDPAVPEPGSMLALASGLFGLGGFAIRRRK